MAERVEGEFRGNRVARGEIGVRGEKWKWKGWAEGSRSAGEGMKVVEAAPSWDRGVMVVRAADSDGVNSGRTCCRSRGNPRRRQEVGRLNCGRVEGKRNGRNLDEWEVGTNRGRACTVGNPRIGERGRHAR